MADSVERRLDALRRDTELLPLPGAAHVRRRGERRRRRQRGLAAATLLLATGSALGAVALTHGHAPGNSVVYSEDPHVGALIVPGDVHPALGPWGPGQARRSVSVCGAVDAALGAVAARRDLDGAVASASATEVVVQEADAAGAAAAVKALATAYDTCAATRRVGGIAVERLTARESTDHGATFRTLRSDTDTQGVGNLEYAGWRVAGADLVYVVVRYHGHGDILGEAAVGQALARAAVRWQGGDPGPDVTVTPVPAPSATTGRRPPQLAAPAFPIRSLTSP